MPTANPDEIYHKASHGRLQNTNNEADSYDDIHFVSLEVEGSKEAINSQKLIREESTLRLKDRLRSTFLIGGTLWGSFFALDAWVGSKAGFPLFGILAKICLGSMILFVIYYIITIIRYSRQARKNKKNPPQQS